MAQIKLTDKIDASVDDTFAALNDIGGVHYWHSYVGTTELLSENNGGLGSARVCYFYSGEQFEEHVFDFSENEHIGIEIRGGMPAIVKSNKAFLMVKKISNNQTEVTMKVDFELGYGLVGKLMGRFMMMPQFTKLTKNVLSGLKSHLETGNYIGRGGNFISGEYTFEDDMVKLEELPSHVVANI